MDGLTFHALGNAAEVRDLFEGIVRITGAGTMRWPRPCW